MDPEEISPKESSEKSRLSQIRTYQGDMASAIGDQKESLVSIQQQEVARQRGSAKPQEHSGREKMVLLLIGGVLLLTLASFGGWFTYQEYLRRSAPPVSLVPESRLISAAFEETVTLLTTTTRSELIKILRDGAQGVPPDQIKHVSLVDPSGEPTSIEAFLTTLEARAPSSLIRSFSPIFMFGILGGETPSSFLIIELDSFENAYARMLSWEEEIADNIGPIFPSATRLSNVTNPKLQDLIDKNKDMRVLLDAEGEEVLLYSFFSNDILIITDEIETLHRVISRLTSESLIR